MGDGSVPASLAEDSRRAPFPRGRRVPNSLRRDLVEVASPLRVTSPGSSLEAYEPDAPVIRLDRLKLIPTEEGQ